MARIAPSFESQSPGDGTRTLLTFAAVIAALYFGAEILVPIALAILLSFVMAPAVRALGKLGLGRVLPVAITALFTALLLAGLGALIMTQVRDLSSDLPRYETTMLGKIQAIKSLSSGGGVLKIEEAVARLTSAIERTPPHADAAGEGASTPGRHTTATDAAPAAPMPVQVIQPAMSPVETMMLVAAPLVHPLSTAFIVVIFVIFILLQREDLRNRAIRLFGASDLQRATAAINDGAKRLSRYLLTQCAVNAVAGCIVGLALFTIGVPSPILFGVLFACMRFVPYVGPVIGAVLPIALATAVDPGWSMAIWTIVALVIVEFSIGQVVEPFAYGHNTGLSPIAIIIAATFWTVLWGPVGLLLSTPLTVCLVVLGRHVEHLAFLDVLLGDQPPLKAPEIFYQRMLASDPVEAADHAQRCLADISISQYYDDVALPAMLLAQDDAVQGRLDRERQEQIKATALEVVDDLEQDGQDGADKAKVHFWTRVKADDESKPATPDSVVPGEVPAHLRPPGSVLCIGARGPLDDVAAVMLMQVLKHHDIGARDGSFASLSKAGIASLDVTGVSLICVSALDSSSPAFLRFVMRRLRRHAPQARLLVGTWWRRDGLRETDQDIDEAVEEPKVSAFVDVVRFCVTPERTRDTTSEPGAAKAGPRVLTAAT